MINRPHHPQPTTPDTHRSTADFLPGACRTGGRMRLFLGAQHKFSAFVQIVFPSKKRRSSLSRKSGRHMGVERPCVLGHFEVKPLNRGSLATVSDPKRERVFFEPYANHMSRTNSWSHDLRNRENRGDHHGSGGSLGAPRGYLLLEQGTAENSRNPRTLRLLYRNKKACEIVGLHRRLKQTGGAHEI